MEERMTQHPGHDEVWDKLLNGRDPSIRRFIRLLKAIPSEPRCKFCGAPFGGLGKPIMRLLGRGRSNLNPSWCNFCEIVAQEHPGGAEIELTMFFADVRGSTGLAEQMSPREFTALLNRFYAVATRIFADTNAMLDKMVGDEVIALYIPGLAGPNHAEMAVQAAQNLLVAMGYQDAGGPWLPIGIGIHTGVAYVGVVGAEGITDITALGDAMNIAARLVAQAKDGEVVMSEATYRSSRFPGAALEQRRLRLKGHQEEIDARILRVTPEAAQ
jgi:adenylate cyclase